SSGAARLIARPEKAHLVTGTRDDGAPGGGLCIRFLGLLAALDVVRGVVHDHEAARLLFLAVVCPLLYRGEIWPVLAGLRLGVLVPHPDRDQLAVALQLVRAAEHRPGAVP